MLKYDPSQRITAAKAMQHPYFASLGQQSNVSNSTKDANLKISNKS